MSLASVIGTMRKRIQQLEREVGRLSRRLGEELPPEWEAMKLAINPLCMNYTPIVPWVATETGCRKLVANVGGGADFYYDEADPEDIDVHLWGASTGFVSCFGLAVPIVPAQRKYLAIIHEGMDFEIALVGTPWRHSTDGHWMCNWIGAWPWVTTPMSPYEYPRSYPGGADHFGPAIIPNSAHVPDDVIMAAFQGGVSPSDGNYFRATMRVKYIGSSYGNPQPVVSALLQPADVRRYKAWDVDPSPPGASLWHWGAAAVEPE